MDLCSSFLLLTGIGEDDLVLGIEKKLNGDLVLTGHVAREEEAGPLLRPLAYPASSHLTSRWMSARTVVEWCSLS